MGGSDERSIMAIDLRRVALAGAALVLVASAWAASQELQLLYADARSHLTIARRLVDGPNRGMVQLGTVWLPFQHLLLAPFAAIGALWTSGWAGAIVGAACMAVSVAAIWFLATVLSGGSRLAGLLGAVLYATNPTILFLHTAAFAEPVLYASVLTATAGLVHWATRPKPFSGGEMALYCGAPTALAVLARYDGWAFAAVATVAVAVLAWRRWGSPRRALELATCFALPPAGAALWWMWFNWVNFGDALEFQRGRYSAQAQQDVLAQRGELPDQGDLARSIGTFAEATWSAIGWIALAAAVAGAIVVVVRIRRSDDQRATAAGTQRALVLVGVLALVPVAFYIWSLVSGQIALRLDTTATQSTFNLRYGAVALPGLAVLGAVALAEIGRGAAWRRGAAVALALCPFVALAVVPGWRDVGVIREGLEQREAGADQWAAAEWLHDELDGERLLIDDSVNPMLPVIGLGLDDVVAPFSEGWDDALRSPDGIDVVLIDRGNPDDEVGRALERDPDLLDGFELAAEFGPVAIFRTEEAGS
jgi:hypothetical protein